MHNEIVLISSKNNDHYLQKAHLLHRVLVRTCIFQKYFKGYCNQRKRKFKTKRITIKIHIKVQNKIKFALVKTFMKQKYSPNFKKRRTLKMGEQGLETRDKSIKQLQEQHLQFFFFLRNAVLPKNVDITIYSHNVTKKLPGSTKKPIIQNTKELDLSRRCSIAAVLTNHFCFHGRQTKQLEVCIF